MIIEIMEFVVKATVEEDAPAAAASSAGGNATLNKKERQELTREIFEKVMETLAYKLDR